jgi:hypothetical protein
MSCLAPCPACNRHVDTDVATCPFCSTALPDSFRCQPGRKALRGRLSRAGLIAAGATLIGIGQSCASSAYGGSVVPDAATEAGTMDGSAVALYGAAPAPLEQAAPDPTPPKKPAK